MDLKSMRSFWQTVSIRVFKGYDIENVDNNTVDNIFDEIIINIK